MKALLLGLSLILSNGSYAASEEDYIKVETQLKQSIENEIDKLHGFYEASALIEQMIEFHEDKGLTLTQIQKLSTTGGEYYKNVKIKSLMNSTKLNMIESLMINKDVNATVGGNLVEVVNLDLSNEDQFDVNIYCNLDFETVATSEDQEAKFVIREIKGDSYKLTGMELIDIVEGEGSSNPNRYLGFRLHMVPTSIKSDKNKIKTLSCVKASWMYDIFAPKVPYVDGNIFSGELKDALNKAFVMNLKQE